MQGNRSDGAAGPPPVTREHFHLGSRVCILRVGGSEGSHALSEMRFHILPGGGGGEAPSPATLHGALAAPGQRHAPQPSVAPAFCKPEASGSQPRQRARPAPALPARLRKLREECPVPCPKLSPALRMSKHGSSEALVSSKKSRREWGGGPRGRQGVRAMSLQPKKAPGSQGAGAGRLP